MYKVYKDTHQPLNGTFGTILEALKTWSGLYGSFLEEDEIGNIVVTGMLGQMDNGGDMLMPTFDTAGNQISTYHNTIHNLTLNKYNGMYIREVNES